MLYSVRNSIACAYNTVAYNQRQGIEITRNATFCSPARSVSQQMKHQGFTTLAFCERNATVPGEIHRWQGIPVTKGQ